MFELSYAICLHVHFHKQATNCFSNVNKNTMISGLWVPLKAVSSQNLKHASEAQREQQVLPVYIPACTHSRKRPIREPDRVPPRFTHTVCLLPREMGAAGPCHRLASPVSLAVLEEPRLMLSLAPMCSQVRSRGVPAQSSQFPMCRDSCYIK